MNLTDSSWLTIKRPNRLWNSEKKIDHINRMISLTVIRLGSFNCSLMIPIKFQPLFSVSDLTSRLRSPSVASTVVEPRRKSMSTPTKEKNVIVILAVISILFATCNIPQSVCRIMNGPDNAKNAAFQVVLLLMFVNKSEDF